MRRRIAGRFTLRVITIGVLIAALGTTLPGAEGQFGRIKNLLEKVSLSNFIKGDPPVTTSLDQALTAIEYLDGYEPTGFMPLSLQPQDAVGVFQLQPGVYDFGAESYCLKAGTYGPGSGEGYLYAPLAGPKGAIVKSILQNSVAHPDIPQNDVQVLLWAIIARTKITDMSRKNQVTAARLLTPSQLFELNGGALGLVPDSVQREARQSLPPAALRVFEAEARMRQLLTQADASYDEIERVAVLLGDPAPERETREVPRGRWSYHPDGYFLRFLPGGYSRTEIQLYVPEDVEIVRDTAGRIAAIVDASGARIDVAYAASAPVTLAGDSAVLGHSFQSVRFEQPSFRGPGILVLGIEPLVAAKERYRTALRDLTGWQTLLASPALRRRTGAPPDMRDLVDLAQLQAGLEMAFTATGNKETISMLPPVRELVVKAWGTAFCQQAGGCASRREQNASGMLHQGPRTAQDGWQTIRLASVGWGSGAGLFSVPGQQPRPAPLPTATTASKSVDLSGHIAVPGHTLRQRLGQSGRSQPNPNLCQGRWVLGGSVNYDVQVTLGVPFCFCYWDCDAFAHPPGPVIRSPNRKQRMTRGIAAGAIDDPESFSSCICNKPGGETGWR